MAIDKFRKINLVLDRANDFIIDALHVMQGDLKGRELVVQITNAGAVEEQSELALNLGWYHTGVQNKGLNPFEPLDAAQGVFIIRYDENMLTPGKVVAAIQIITGDGVINTRPFEIVIGKNPIDATAIVTADSFTSLTEALNRVQKWNLIIDNVLAENTERITTITQNSIDTATRATADNIDKMTRATNDNIENLTRVTADNIEKVNTAIVENTHKINTSSTELIEKANNIEVFYGEQLSELKTSHENRFFEHGLILDGHSDKLNDLTANLTTMNNNLTTANTNITAANTNITAANANITTANKNITANKDEITKLNNNKQDKFIPVEVYFDITAVTSYKSVYCVATPFKQVNLFIYIAKIETPFFPKEFILGTMPVAVRSLHTFYAPITLFTTAAIHGVGTIEVNKDGKLTIFHNSTDVKIIQGQVTFFQIK